jgi:hypothetical protein
MNARAQLEQGSVLMEHAAVTKENKESAMVLPMEYAKQMKDADVKTAKESNPLAPLDQFVAMELVSADQVRKYKNSRIVKFTKIEGTSLCGDGQCLQDCSTNGGSEKCDEAIDVCGGGSSCDSQKCTCPVGTMTCVDGSCR